MTGTGSASSGANTGAVRWYRSIRLRIAAAVAVVVVWAASVADMEAEDSVVVPAAAVAAGEAAEAAFLVVAQAEVGSL